MRTGNGTILAFIEARTENCADGGLIDILLAHSKTARRGRWTQSALVYSEGFAENKIAIGDHCPVWDYWIGIGQTGGLHFLSGRLVIPMHNKGSGCRGILSEDHGATWQQGGIVGGDECQFQQLLNGTFITASRQSLG